MTSQTSPRWPAAPSRSRTVCLAQHPNRPGTRGSGPPFALLPLLSSYASETINISLINLLTNTRMEGDSRALGKKSLAEDDHAIFVTRDFNPSVYVNDAVKAGNIREAKSRAEHTLRTVDEQISCEVQPLSFSLYLISSSLDRMMRYPQPQWGSFQSTHSCLVE